MKIQIKSKIDAKVLFECKADSVKMAVEIAIKANANLRSANLRYADLSSADLRSADLRSANLRSADLSYADLRSANLRSADLSYADLSSADLRYANLRSADLSYADLSSADLRYANLRSADIDFSCWPLWCGSKKVKVDMKIVYQLMAHVCVLDCDDKIFKKVQKFLLPFAKKFHKWEELNR
jgi:hypothetical protein